jgi:hypothetical protein
MKTFLKAAAVAAIGATVMFSAAPAMARVNVDLNIGGPAVVYPAPVYVQPQPVYVQPQPVYVQPRPVYVQPAPVYTYGNHWNRGRHYGRGDQDHDGVPNRFDRDRDGDGVPNRYDRAPDNPYRR